MRDRTAGVGGLIHLLLPEPPSMDLSWNPVVSAGTGMPIFIEALLAQGARKERLVATIAGGALIDPVSESDLVLDIGGRTAEIAQSILNRENIPIVDSEIGGYYSCCLSLNLGTMDATIEPIVYPGAKGLSTQAVRRPEPEQLERVIQTLLPVPQTALKIIRMINSAHCSFRDLAMEVVQDQVLSARIIRMCNSVAIQSRMKVESIEKALVRIGEKNLLLMALSFSLEDFISRAYQGYSLCKGGLFRHSLWTATLSSRLAEMTGAAPPDLAYTAGLLHDIGKVVLDQYVYDAHPLFYRQLQKMDIDLLDAEKELFGLTHCEAGGRLALRFGLPRSIEQAILHHHDPDFAESDYDMVHIVYVADLLCCRFNPGLSIDKKNTSHLESSMTAIGFNARHVPLLFSGNIFPAIAGENTNGG
ncbi:MAG: HDOD domain-containing protein [Desulfobacteraceae bacterium]|nr:HDOD domain-containing protein [Desulfobacteraceae bacterium]